MNLLGQPVTLALHAVGDVDPADDPDRLVLAPRHLEGQVRALQRLGYRFVLPRDLRGRAPRGRTAVLTFDDGWLDARTTVVPLLERLGVPAAFYVCSGWLELGQHPLVPGEAGRLLNADDVAWLADRTGVEVGSHAIGHPDLRGCEGARLDEELQGSKAVLEEVTGRPVTTLAYPYGLHDPRVQSAAARAGYELAWTWATGPWAAHAAPRLPAPVRDGGGRLVLKLAGVRAPDRAYKVLRRLRP